MSARHERFCVAHPEIHGHVLPYFPLFDYRHCIGDRNVICDYRNPNNRVGDQQRAFSVWWAVEKGGPTDMGLDIGSSKGLTPYAAHVDLFGTGEVHPQERYRGGGSPYFADIVHEGATIDAIIPKNSLPFIVSNHSIEHMPPKGSDYGIAAVLSRWVSLLRSGGVLAMVIPDNDEFDVMGCDPDHKNAWGHSDFQRRVLDQVLARGDVKCIEYNTLSNNFSFNVVLEKS